MSRAAWFSCGVISFVFWGTVFAVYQVSFGQGVIRATDYMTPEQIRQCSRLFMGKETIERGVPCSEIKEMYEEWCK